MSQGKDGGSSWIWALPGPDAASTVRGMSDPNPSGEYPHVPIVWVVTDQGRVSMIFTTEAAAQAHRDWLIVNVGSNSIDVEVEDWFVLGPA